MNTEQGHIYTYNRSLGDAVRLVGWEHTAAVRAAAQVPAPPESWEFCLGKPATRFRRGPLAKIEKMLELVATLNGYLRQKARDEARPMILFLEWFDPVHIVAFSLALLALNPRRRFAVWVLYRLGMHNRWWIRFFRIFHAIVRMKLGPDRLTLLSDSSVIARDLTAQMRQTVHVVPIPHAALNGNEPVEFPSPDLSPCDHNRLTCWWPGQPAVTKGLAEIDRITRMAETEDTHLRIIAAAGSHLQAHANGCDVMLVPDVLTRPQYIGWLRSSDIILLPYDPAVYSERTSGIFCEAISAGKMVAVTDGTWMANELKEHDLAKLILSWQQENLPLQLHQLHDDPIVRQKLAGMQQVYSAYHTEQGLAQRLKQIYEQTATRNP
ncbi:MAG: hypothetical protein M1434_05370 [Chloroflexi bacterium]|nr:hypothetical protein [Chloroflexota bacterium]